jgi:hypothetical protein
MAASRVQRSSSPTCWPTGEAFAVIRYRAIVHHSRRAILNAPAFCPIFTGICEYRGLRYFLLCDFKAWLTHEVTIARTFVHPFCTCLPTPSEK